MDSNISFYKRQVIKCIECSSTTFGTDIDFLFFKITPCPLLHSWKVYSCFALDQKLIEATPKINESDMDSLTH